MKSAAVRVPMRDGERPCLDVDWEGPGGNAYSIMANAGRLMKRHGYTPYEVEEVMKEATAGDFDYLQEVIEQYVELD